MRASQRYCEVTTSNREQSFEDWESVGSLGLLMNLDLVPGSLAWPVVPQHYLALYVLLLLVVRVGGGPVQALLGGSGGSAAPDSLLLATCPLQVGGGPLEVGGGAVQVGGGHLDVPHPLPPVQGAS